MLHYIEIITLEGKCKVFMFTLQIQSHFTTYLRILNISAVCRVCVLISYNIDD